MSDFYFHALFYYFCLYLSSFTQFLPHLLIQHSNSSGKLPLHLRLFHPPIYPYGPPEPSISATIFPGGLQSSLNERIAIALASMWDWLVLISVINGLQATFNEIISSALAYVSVYYCNMGWRSFTYQGVIDLRPVIVWNSFPSYYFLPHLPDLLLHLPLRNSCRVCRGIVFTS